MKKRKIFLFTTVLLLMLTGCSGGMEQKKRDRLLQTTRTMVSDITDARTDNRTADEIGKVFNKYIDRIDSTIWEEWYDTENLDVRMMLGVAEAYGYYPVDNEIDILYVGEHPNGEYSYTVVSTMKVKEEGGELMGKVRYYQYFYFDSDGMLSVYHNSSRLMGGLE